jgi:hypothetical protein
MKKLTACLVVLVFLAAFAYLALAQPAQEEEAYLIGNVVGYEAGKSITVEDENGTHQFALTEETEMGGQIETGMTVEVEAQGGKATYVGPIEAEEGPGQ